MDKLKPKLFSVMKTYTKKQFATDVVSGIIVAIIALPLSIALALASGVGPQEGLYTAIIAGFIISFLGGSRVQIAGPTAAFATMVAGIVAVNGMSGLATATILAGIFLVLMGIFRFGSLIQYIPTTITTGFTFGIAVTIVVGQIKDFLGLTFKNTPIETIDKLKEVASCIGTTNKWALIVGIASLIILFAWPKKLNMIPASLVAVILASVAVAYFKLPVSTIGVKADGSVNYTISASLPHFVAPDFSPAMIRKMLPDAFTIAVLAAIESLLSCVVSDAMIGSKHRSNMELVAQGCGNAASALFGGIPATGAIARTAANVKNGGRTPIAGMVHSVVLLCIMVFLMPYASLIPMPTIAAILFQVAYNMSGWRTVAHHCKASPKSDIFVLWLTLILTVFFDLVVAIGIGLVIASLLFMKRMADVTDVHGWIYKDQLDEESDVDNINLKTVPKNTRVFEINGPMFFAASEKFLAVIDSTEEDILIIRMRNVPAVDATGILTLEKIYEKCKKDNVKLIFSHVNEQPMKAMEKSGYVEKIGKENFCVNIDAALERATNMNK
ncbi:MAG TPA: STAS domain-containing protein [Lachnospiraceae bacterium]|nr:STAS domain-containing protein [Lachnospiraceae bacterium]